MKNYINEILENDKLSQREKDLALKSLKKLEARGLPILLNLKHLSEATSVSEGVLLSIINSQHNFYRDFKIKKRRGGFRKISAPFPSVLFIQKWINERILSRFELSDAAEGFVKNKSIITNARRHLDSSIVLKVDIKDFFPTIDLKRIIGLFSEFGYLHKISFYLAKICTFNNILPQGGASSPSISNLICRSLDKRLIILSQKAKINYSRYADDLAFSGYNINYNLINTIESILYEEGFLINKDKTVLMTGKGKKIITGISISRQLIKLPRPKKRKIRLEAYYTLKNTDVTISNMLKDPFYLERILGKINFWLQVEPDNRFAQHLFKSISELNKNATKLVLEK